MSDFEKWYSNALAEARANGDKDLHKAICRNVGLYKYGFEAAIAWMHGQVKPSFYASFGQVDEEWIPIPEYSAINENEVKNLILQKAQREGFKGTADERLAELGWKVFPVYLRSSAEIARLQNELDAYKKTIDDVTVLYSKNKSRSWVMQILRERIDAAIRQIGCE